MSSHRPLPYLVRGLSAAILTLALAACGGGGSSSGVETPAPAPAETTTATNELPTGTATGTDTATQGTDTSAVTLITAGEEPRTQLRYDLTDGQAVSATMRQGQELTQTIDGQRGQTVAVTTLFDLVGEVQADGDTFTVPMIMENVRVADDTDPGIKEAVEASLSALEAATFTTTMDAHGQIIDSRIEDVGQIDPSMMSMFDSVEQSALSAPLPADPVGVGARWSSVQELDAQGFAIEQTTEAEVLSIDGTVVELAYTTTQEAPSGPVTLQGTEIDVRDWEVDGEGTALLDLTYPFPTSQARAEGYQEMATTIDGQTSVLEQDISTDVEVSPN